MHLASFRARAAPGVLAKLLLVVPKTELARAPRSAGIFPLRLGIGAADIRRGAAPTTHESRLKARAILVDNSARESGQQIVRNDCPVAVPCVTMITMPTCHGCVTVVDVSVIAAPSPQAREISAIGRVLFGVNPTTRLLSFAFLSGRTRTLGRRQRLQENGKSLLRGGRHAILPSQLTCREPAFFLCLAWCPRALFYGSGDVPLGAEGNEHRHVSTLDRLCSSRNRVRYCHATNDCSSCAKS